jgi:hypothetical protein
MREQWISPLEGAELCGLCKARQAALVRDPAEKFVLIAIPNKNPALGSGRAQLLSFDLLNALIWPVASSA